MKTSYWLIPGAVAIAAIVGAAVATVDRPDSIAPVPTVSTAPALSGVQVPASPIAASAPPAIAQTPTATSAATPTPSEILSQRSPVTINGIGPVKVGMTIEEASHAAGMPIVSSGDNTANPGCAYFRPQTIPNGIGFMVTAGHIARVDIWHNSPVKTLSGAGIGSTEAEIKALFPGQIEVTPHEYVQGGHYLTFVPKDESDRNYRIVFETDANGRVTQFRAGKLSEVTWVEGCA